MGTCRETLAITTVLCISISLVASFELIVEQKKTELTPGETIQFMCKMNDALFSDQLHVVKKLDDGTIMDVSVNRQVQAPFAETLRYIINRSHGGVLNQVRTFQLLVSDAQVQDSGEYGCKVPSRNVQKFAPRATVYGPATNMYMELEELNQPVKRLYHGDSLDMANLANNRAKKLTCHVEGSLPIPDVKVMIGDRDITGEFNKGVNKEVQDGTVGLKQFKTIVTLKNQIFSPTIEDSGKYLKCVATVPQQPPEEVSVKLDLKFKPEVECKKKLAAPGDKNVEVVCTGRANPRVTSATWFKVTNGRRTALPNDTHHHSETEFQEDNKFTVKLVIHEIEEGDHSHYGEYEVEVTNSEGRAPHAQASLEKGPSVDNGSDRTSTMSILSILAAVLVFFA